MYCQELDVDFRSLNKENRFHYVEKLSNKLLAAIEHVIPILPVALIVTIFESNPKAKLHAIDIVEKVNQLISQLMDDGSAMKDKEKPKQQTIIQSLELLVTREILLKEGDYYWLNIEAITLAKYYSNSIRHFHLKSPSAPE